MDTAQLAHTVKLDIVYTRRHATDGENVGWENSDGNIIIFEHDTTFSPESHVFLG